MTKLIAFIDGSNYSQSVCDHAAWMAVGQNAAVEVLHVLGRRDVTSETANLSGSIGLGARTALLEELAELDAQKAKLAQKRGRLVLDEAKARLMEDGVTDVSTKLRIGDIVEAVHEFEQEADLIIIGKRGEDAGFAKLHLGSNLERVVRSSKKPLLVASRAFKPIKRVLIAVDGGASAKKAVAYIAQNQLFADLECRILTVGTDNAEAQQRLSEAESTMRASNRNVETLMVPGHADVAIAKYVEAEDIDLLVMGAYGHSRIRNLVIGSTTSEMIRSCKTPVMLFR